jgi:hypothetical protein
MNCARPFDAGWRVANSAYTRTGLGSRVLSAVTALPRRIRHSSRQHHAITALDWPMGARWLLASRSVELHRPWASLALRDVRELDAPDRARLRQIAPGRDGCDRGQHPRAPSTRTTVMRPGVNSLLLMTTILFTAFSPAPLTRPRHGSRRDSRRTGHRRLMQRRLKLRLLLDSNVQNCARCSGAGFSRYTCIPQRFAGTSHGAGAFLDRAQAADRARRTSEDVGRLHRVMA